MTQTTRPIAERRSRSRPPVWAGLTLGLATLAAYLPGLGRSLDFDSAQTVGMFVKLGPPWAVFSRQAAFNNHPAFSFLEQLVRVVTGRTDAATMRLLPILLGAAAVAVLTWYAARRLGVVAGVVAGALLAANPTFASLSRSVRGYSLLVLCAVVSTVLVAEDRPDRPGWYGVAYVAVAGAGVATHLFMLPVIAAHAGAIVARGRLDGRWRARFLGVALVGAAAYAGMAATMVGAGTAHGRRFQAAIPWRMAGMAGGGGWAALALAPLAAAGAVLALRRSRAARGAALALVAVVVLLWAGLRPSSLTERFFVWTVPLAAYLAAVAVARLRAAAALGVLGAALAVASMASQYTADPTAYRQAAVVVHRAGAAGLRSCVVDVGVSPMLAYLDTPADFAAVTDPSQLDGCDVVVVAAWWPSTADWYASDRRVIAEAETRFPYRQVLPARDRILVLSSRPLPE